eukprot:363221-Chlamydomonas_euryale.AAC.21
MNFGVTSRSVLGGVLDVRVRTRAGNWLCVGFNCVPLLRLPLKLAPHLLTLFCCTVCRGPNHQALARYLKHSFLFPDQQLLIPLPCIPKLWRPLPAFPPSLTQTKSFSHLQDLKARLRAACPTSVVLESFLGPAELARLYQGCRLNVHPPSYDAYGMTIVEAASQGAPSLVHGGGGGGRIGATDLLSATAGNVLLTDMTAAPAHLAAEVCGVWHVKRADVHGRMGGSGSRRQEG